MTVKKLIEILSKEVKPVDRKNANIEFWCGYEKYVIKSKSMHRFGLSPDVIIELERANPKPLVTPVIFKAKHKKMIKRTVKEINKDVKRGKRY